MGKPIAGQNQFPYTVGGFLVDGAKINGVTYAKKLYIYKQRSYDTYDLQDSSGNIFRFIKIGYQDTNGKMLNYFDVAEELVKVIPDNTFFLKIQDPARNIFSFVRIYQWHKCITVQGDYVYRTPDIDPQLGGVLINPAISTIQVGTTLSYESLFYPTSYKDKDGSWFINGMEGLDETTAASLESSKLNTAVVKGTSVGKAVLSFVPSKNDSLVTHSIVNIVDEELELTMFKVFNTDSYDYYKYGDEYTLQVVTYPYDAVIENPIQIDIEEQGYGDFSTVTELVSVSSDNKQYTFKTTYTGRPEEESYSAQYPQFAFKMSTPIEYEFWFGDIMVCGIETYKDSYNQLGDYYQIPFKLRPNMTFKAEKVVDSLQSTLYPYVSSDPEIATLDYETGIVTTYDKKGTVTFKTQFKNYDGEMVDADVYGQLIVMDEVFDQIIREPAQVTSIAPGTSMKFTFTGYREGYEPMNIPVRASFYPKTYTVSNDGTVTVASLTEANKDTLIGSQVYVQPSSDINIDTQLLYPYRSPGTMFRVQPEGTVIPMTGIYSSVGYDNDTIFVPLGEDTGVILLHQPYMSNQYQMEFESYDDTILELVDPEFLFDTYQYSMTGALMPIFKTLKRGSTELVVRSVHVPDVKLTIRFIVY